MSDLRLFHGPNAGYVLDLYERYRRNPESVDPATRAIFQSWTPEPNGAPASRTGAVEEAAIADGAPPRPASRECIQPVRICTPGLVDTIVRAARLGRMVRELGHLAARIDPLGSDPPGDPELEASYHGLTPEDLEALPALVVGGPLAEQSANALEAIEKLRQVYCGSVGYEDDQVQIAEERDWLREAVETQRFFQGFTAEEEIDLLERLTEVETFERFLHTTFAGQKRFSIEGTDMLVPMLDRIIHEAAANGTSEVVMGMSHRGRLNVLAHVLGKPYSAILAEFQSSLDEKPAVSGGGTQGWAGDVKYHLGAHMAYMDGAFHEMPLTLAPNPSHLEYVDPVVLGRTRAAQECRDRPGAPERNPRAAGSILVHGDAAFPGQGIVAETLNLSQLPGFSVGGTIHIIVNNQIGFTTDPSEGRSTLYASDLAKGFEIPVVHVNADDVIACIAVARMALAYSMRFHKDFVIDLVGYRRWGHNEGDEPAFTQPLMVAAIAAHPTVRQIWAQNLERRGVVSREQPEAMVKAVQERLQQSRWARVDPDPKPVETLTASPPGTAAPLRTAVSADRLRALNDALLTLPEGFRVNPRLERLLSRRRAAVEADEGIDWSHAEALAFASILADGTPIRLTGQDVERGTFSQRHAVLHDPTNGATHVPLQNLPMAAASFAIYNSPLSENAVLGFEYGYSMHATEALVLWEAQFGDFVNAAQVIVDQFIVSGYAKWRQTPSLVLLLPHGYEGQGPEHSSARMERFLRLAARDNLRIANCTTAAQYFHLLRRQAALIASAPRPLIVFTPKSLLRHPLAASKLESFTEGRFEPVLDDPTFEGPPSRVGRVILCSGKVYVDLVSRYPDKDVPALRLEQLYPFPADELGRLLSRYRNLQEVVWMQEEPKNMGAWGYAAMRIRDVKGPDVKLVYVGRPESASPAEGSLRQHTLEQERILAEALGIPAPTREKKGEAAHVS